MPDLMTHFTASYLLKRVIAPKFNMVPFLMGATLPDILAYIPIVIAGYVPSGLFPGWLVKLPYFFLPFHSLFGFFLFSWLWAMLFAEEARPGVFINLALGGLLHFVMDALQVQHGEFGLLFFPFSWRSIQLGWIETEASLQVLPYLVVLAGVVFFTDHKGKTGRLRSGQRKKSH